MVNPLIERGYIRRAHSATEGERGILTGSLTITTDAVIADEVAARQELKRLITGREFPLFGQGPPLLRSIAFAWAIAKDEQELYGAAVKCVIRISYIVQSD